MSRPPRYLSDPVSRRRSRRGAYRRRRIGAAAALVAVAVVAWLLISGVPGGVDAHGSTVSWLQGGVRRTATLH
ncbi:MAG TPA: hypothetical protein VGG08_10070 [Solirubrobacteraceae bacterium]